MTPEQLLRACETATYKDRMYNLVELGRIASRDTSISHTITTFMRGNVYQRVLAVQSCYGSHDSALALQALSDPSRSVRAMALDLVALICNDAELQTALTSIPFHLQEVLFHRLHRRHRQTAIDNYLDTLATRQDASLKKLLPFGSPATVTRHLEQVVAQFELTNWQRLARLHPSITLAQLQAISTTSTTNTIDSAPIDQRLILQVNAVLPLLAHSSPDLALNLVQTFVASIPLSQLDLATLTLKRPNAIADLLLQSEEQIEIDFAAAIQRLDIAHLQALFTHHPHTVSSHYFHKLTPQQRLALYAVCARGWRTATGVLSEDIVAALPTIQRIQEAHRHLALPDLLTKPIERFRYAAFLPWDDARATLDPPLHSPDADLRGAALRALITTTRYERNHLTDLLQLIRNRRNEQDPVRREMLTALANLPYGIWRAEHLAALSDIIRDALNATDLSQGSDWALESIVIHQVPFHPTWSAAQLATIYRERGQVSVQQLDSYLSNTDVQSIAPTLLPVIQEWQARENTWALIRMALAFGKRMRVFDALADILADILDYTHQQHVANTILHIFSQHCYERFATLIPHLLKEDRSCIVLPNVYTYLHRHRQDLITPFLGQQSHAGRFSTGNTRIVLSLHNGFYRWTPMQQALFAQSLLEIANDATQPTPALLHAISQLTAMPVIDPTHLIKLASDERLPVRDAALRALGNLDAAQGIPTLIEALNDDRSRIAIYALRSSLLAMPPAEALKLLRTVSFARITVAKEVIRLIGDLSSEAAYRELLTLDTRDLHRDLRVALLRALWSHVEQPETWQIFTRAAQSPETALARGVVHIPADGMSSLAQKRLATLIATLLTHPEPLVRIDALQRCIQHPLTDHDHTLLTNLLASMNSPLPKECSLAAQAVFATYTGNDATLIGDALRTLLSNRRALQIACEQFVSTLHSNRRRLVPTTRAILATLSTDTLTLSLRLPLIIQGLPWEEVAQALINLAPALHANALAKAQSAISEASTRPDTDLFTLETTLATSNDERLRRLALAALIAQTHQANGWRDEHIARLQTYRHDPSPLIAEAAQFTFFS